MYYLPDADLPIHGGTVGGVIDLKSVRSQLGITALQVRNNIEQLVRTLSPRGCNLV